MTDLESLIDPSSGWKLYDAYGINSFGQIIGHGIFQGSDGVPFLLTPIPEPATLSLLVLGGLGLIRRRRVG